MDPRQWAFLPGLKVPPWQPILARNGPGDHADVAAGGNTSPYEAAMMAVVMLVTLGTLLLQQPWRRPKPARISYPRTPRAGRSDAR